MKAHFIFYVRDQDRSTDFYRLVLAVPPTLHVPGMTEFTLSENCILGLMPEKGIKNLLGAKLPDLQIARGIPRSEIYLIVESPEAFHQRALSAGAKELSPVLNRNWGDRAGYSLDLDGHVIAFANKAL